jgi:two-component system, NarL family, sensor histidine kinase UhpB
MQVSDRQTMQQTATPSPKTQHGFWQRLASVSIFYKILFANSSIVVLGAIAGTTVTLQWASTSTNVLEFVVLFALLGTLISIIVNWFVLRATFQPLIELERTVDQVRRGNFSVRAERVGLRDPNIDTLSDTMNGMLDTVERYRAQLHNLSMQVVNAQEEERKRIARELHDDTAQVLTAQLLRLKTMEATNQNLNTGDLAQLIEMTAEALEDVRHMAHELRPPSIDDLGLYASVESLTAQFQDRFGMGIRFEVQGAKRRLPPGMEVALYRIIQEALTNVAKHSQATSASVTLGTDETGVWACIQDYGIGFDPSTVDRSDGSGLGLFGMQERTSLFGGQLKIESRRRHGTTVTVRMPLPSGVPLEPSAPTSEETQ